MLVQDCPKEFFDKKSDVLYGTVKHETYFSNTCKMERGYSIILPASYDGKKKFPVLYFQHGIFGDENCIVNDKENYIVEIAGNLAKNNLAKEMIIVFGNMFATDNPELKPGFDQKAIDAYDNYINELINDLMPHIQNNYAVLTGKENTAICGFSMGGRESIYIGLQRSDLFDYIGGIAPAPGLVKAEDSKMKHPGMLSEDKMKFVKADCIPKLFMVCCGSIDSVVGNFPKSYHEIFEKNNVEHLWFEIDKADHNAMAIRTGFYSFLQKIF